MKLKAMARFSKEQFDASVEYEKYKVNPQAKWQIIDEVVKNNSSKSEKEKKEEFKEKI